MYQNNIPYAPQNYGYTYGVQRPQAKYTQPLTADQIAKLRQNNNAFDLKVEPEELLKAACTHKEKNGQSTLIQEDDGQYRCTICGAKFELCDFEPTQVKEAVKRVIDILQTIKTVYVDAPEELIVHYMQQIALLNKLTALWDRSMENFNKYENTSILGVNPIAPGYSGYGALNAMLSNPYQYGYGAQAGMVGQPMYGQPAYGQQPMYGQPVYGQPGVMPQAPVDPSANPMAYGVPNNVPAPAAGVMPAAKPAAAPAAAPQTGEVQQQQVFNV